YHLSKTPVENGCAECPALADEPDISRTSYCLREGSIEAGKWTHDSETVRTYQPHAAPADVCQYVLFQFHSPRTKLFEAGGDNDCPFYSSIYALSYNRRHTGGWSGNNGKIHLLGDRGNIVICFYTEDTSPLWIYRVDRTPERIAQQVP